MVLTNRMKLLTHEAAEKARQQQLSQQHDHEHDVKSEARRRLKSQLTAKRHSEGVTRTGPRPQGAEVSAEAEESEPEKHHTHANWVHDRHGPAHHRIFDSTRERLDAYSNIEVGTRLRHLHFGDRRFGGRFDVTINFTHYVDLDINDYEKLILGRFLRDVLVSYTFRTFILALVILNAVLIGLTTSVYYYEKYKLVFEVLDQIILSVFIFELLIKWKYGFRIFWLVWWNILDFVIIVFICAAPVLPATISQRAILAVVRVGRALRSLRSVSSLTSLVVVFRTIGKSFIDMANIFFVLMIFMVVLAIAGVTLFDDVAFNTTRFLTCLDAWFVCFICVTQDGWIEVLDSFRGVGASNFVLIALYLIIAVIVGALVFANLIVAVVVSNLESAIRALKAEKGRNENPLVYRDEFSPNVIELIPTYAPFRTAPSSILRQRPHIAPRITNLSDRRLGAYQAAIVALEQNMLEYSVIEEDLIRVLGVMLGILQQMEKRESTLEEDVLRRQQALKDLQAYSHLNIPNDAISRAMLHKSFSELKGHRGRSVGSTTNLQ